MLIVVIANGEDQKEFQDKQIPEGVQVQFVTTLEEAKDEAGAYFYLLDDNAVSLVDKIEALKAPVFVKGLTDVKKLPANVAGISPWPGFLFAESIEVHAKEENLQSILNVLNKLQWKYNHTIVE
jgi:hypothetical protein